MDMMAPIGELASTQKPVQVKIPVKNPKSKGFKKSLEQFTVIKPREEDKQAVKKDIETEEPKSVLSLTPVALQTKMSKVAILSWDCIHGEPNGPRGVYACNLASVMARGGDEVHVFTRRKQGQAANEIIDGVNFHRIQVDPSLSMLKSCYSFGASIYETIKEIEAKGRHFDVIHCHDWQPAKAIESLQNGIPRRIVLTLHSNDNLIEFEKADETARQAALFEKGLVQWSQKIFFHDQKVKADIQERFSLPDNKLFVVSEPFNWQDFQGIKDQGEIKRRYAIGPIDPLALFVGEFNDAYAPDILVDAIPALLKNNPQVRFLLVGEGELMWTMRLKAHYLYFEHAIRLVGHKEGRDLYDLFQTADMVVIPNRKRAKPFQVLSAWSAKKPVVATQAGGCGLINHEENGIQIYDNTSSMVWGVEKILFDWQNAHMMAQRGWNNIQENYTWEGIARKMKGI
ncbi:glycosyltransferase family 4 protein [bacterium]|nr:glycosyltransferase family 4 protein [bacterium]